MRASAVALITACALLCMWTLKLQSQIAEARLEGTVRDETQAVVPAATVSVVNTETGARRSTVTDANGRYVFANLPPAPHWIVRPTTGRAHDEGADD